MFTLNTALENIRDYLDTQLGTQVKEIELFGGFFDDTNLRRIITNAPMILVSVLAVHDYKQRDMRGWIGSPSFSVYIITKGANRQTQVLDLCMQVMQFIAASRWGDEEHFRPVSPANMSMRNMYSGAINSIDSSVFAITWTQEIRFDISP